MNVRAMLLVLTTLCVAACSRQETVREIDWAKAALARNPDFEIVATDESAGVFTVRDNATGTVRTLKLSELVAAPKAASAPTVPAAAAPENMPVESPEVADDTGDEALTAQTTEDAAIPAQTPGANALAEGPGYSISRGTGNKPEAATATLEGPGYKIERQGEPAKRQADEQAAAAQAASVERRSDPIVCQGNRLMHIDGETMEFSGDAVIAEKGCDLYISNAHISAGGVGIIARQARVHIVNSTIGGIRGSYEASAGGEIYVARSTFSGVGRRFDGGTMTDLGGNSYESD